MIFLHENKEIFQNLNNSIFRKKINIIMTDFLVLYHFNLLIGKYSNIHDPNLNKTYEKMYTTFFVEKFPLFIFYNNHYGHKMNRNVDIGEKSNFES